MQIQFTTRQAKALAQHRAELAATLTKARAFAQLGQLAAEALGVIDRDDVRRVIAQTRARIEREEATLQLLDVFLQMIRDYDAARSPAVRHDVAAAAPSPPASGDNPE